MAAEPTPVICHFRDCKVLLVISLTHISKAIASVQIITLMLTLKPSDEFSSKVSNNGDKLQVTSNAVNKTATLKTKTKTKTPAPKTKTKTKAPAPETKTKTKTKTYASFYSFPQALKQKFVMRSIRSYFISPPQFQCCSS